ncbi:MAG: FG-GAP repeat protein [Actinomycetota bacterium]
MRRVAVIISAMAIVLGTGLPAVAPSPPLGMPATSGTAPRSVLTDFNGDGFSDLAVGVPFEDIGAVADAGAVHVLYGSLGGLQATAPDDQFWHQDSPGMEDSAEKDDRFGWSVAAGDFNGDGFADLAVGVPFEDVAKGLGAVADAGAVHVLYGSLGGLQATAPDDQFWHQDSPGVEDSAEKGDRFGLAVAAGDFNGDGFADLAVGVPNEGLGAVADAGAVHVLYGSAGGLQATAPDDQFWHQDSPGVEDSAEKGDEFGFSAAAGDFNNDTFDDLAVGVLLEDLEGTAPIQDAGAVNVLYGSARGLQADSPDDQFWMQGRNGVEDHAEANDYLGWSASTGDFNGDGYADLVVGVPREDVGSESRGVNAGAANVLYGSAGGLQTSAPDDQFWHQDVPGVIGLAEHNDQFGYSVATGDFDDDGFDDLAVGVVSEDGGGESIPESGAVNILYGSAGGLQTARNWHLEQGDDPVEDAAERGDHFGHAVATGDFNGDGFADLAVGVPFEEVEGSANDIGAVHVLYSTAAGLQAEDPDDVLWTQDSPGMEDRGETGDRFGWSRGGPSSAA